MLNRFPVSGDQIKKELRQNGLLKGGLRKLIGWILDALESSKDCGQFYVYDILSILLIDSFLMLFYSHFSKNLRPDYIFSFVLTYIFVFDFKLQDV